MELIGCLDTFGGRTIEDLSQEFLCHIQLTKVTFFSVFYESQVQGKVPSTVEHIASAFEERKGATFVEESFSQERWKGTYNVRLSLERI